jgi:hypothetical protein
MRGNGTTPRGSVAKDVDADPTSHEYDVLLPGEATAMVDPSKRDIEHWISVYAQLCQFKETILGTLVDQREQVPLLGRIEVDHDDMVLRSEYERLRRRLQYWQRVSQESLRAS